MQLTKEQFDTLKDFDLEMHKNGVNICTMISGYFGLVTSEFVAEDTTTIVVRNSNGNLCTLVKDQIQKYSPTLKMLPLFFVEDKPVYPGDVLYDAESGTEVKMYNATSDKQGTYLSWNKSKVKKEAWVNLYRRAGSCTGAGLGSLYETEDMTLKAAKYNASYIKTIRIEWEE